MSHTAEIIAVGTELLLGNITNTNAREISQALSAVGVNVFWHTVVGDSPDRLRQALDIARRRADILITTGGLGPTYDDLTKQTICAAFGKPLVLHPDILEDIRSFYESALHVPMPDNNTQQAQLPEGCTVFDNPVGTAPGCAFEAGGVHVLMLPGPPHEMETMLHRWVEPYLRTLSSDVIVSRDIMTFGMGESSVDALLHETMSRMENPTLATYAKSAGKSEGEYLKQLYGSNMTKKIFQGILKDTIIASHYQQDYIDSLTYTDDELQKYYQENKNSFDVANYEMITFNGAAASTKDADGNTVQPTEEESAAALQKAKDSANAALEQVKGGELLVKAAKDYEPIGTYSHPEAGTYSGDAATKWVFDESRQEGDTEIVENGTSIYLLVFHSRTRNDYNTVDVRHILFKVDTTGLDSKVEDYQAKLEELKAGKKQEAENALQAWKDAGGGEEAFAKLANELSDDTGSNTNGGLYKQVYKNKMVTGFNDWCFDESRKAGDTGIVENDGNYIGYHVMYFVGTDDPYWMVQVRNAMTNKAYSEWSANLVKDITATENSGMKYVG